MKDKGILFKPDMVKAADEGRKTQTRRIITRRHLYCQPHQTVEDVIAELKYNQEGLLNCCPYVVGQRLYLKETHYRYGKWVKNGKTKTDKQAWRFVGATKPEEWLFESPDFARVEDMFRRENGWYKRSPLFMPKRFARRWYVVTAVRAERLQDISDEDAQDEGIPNTYRDGVCRWRYLTREDAGCNNPIGPFKELWESIHGPGSWGRNPYVWCICFQKSKKEVG